MRTKTTAAIVTIALLGVIAFSVIGQEEPLPVVIPKANPDIAAIRLAEPTIVLAAEPIREYRPPTLLDAARHNDYITFDALYAAAKRRGEDVSQFDALHELWTYSMTDPIGAFYGQELYQRMSRAYPGYVAYIENFRVVDDRGNVFYPTSETRAFLLDRAAEGRPTPRVLVAEARSTPNRTAIVERRPLPAAEPVVIAKKLSVATSAPLGAGSAGTAPLPAAIATKPAADAGTAPVPTVVATKPAADAATAPVPTVVATKPAAESAVAPAVVAAAPAVAEPIVIAAPATQDPTAGRGILLMIIGLIGVGLLALVLRTPREEPVTVVHGVHPGVNNVEPLRKAPTTPPDETRASGSAAG